MTAPTRITLTYLRSFRACEEGLADFRSAFPRGLTVRPGARFTKRTAERLATLAHHFDWFARTLPAPAQDEYDRATDTALVEHDRVHAGAWTEYERVRAAARAEYYRVRAPAQDEYDRATDTALVEYDRAVAPARAEYERVRAAARAEYDRVRAGALWRALGGVS